MRFSIVRIDKKRVLRLSLKPAEWFLERIKTNTKSQEIGELRRHIATFGDAPASERQTNIARVYPSVELAKTGNGNLEIVAFNGLVALHVPELLRKEDRQAVKEASKIRDVPAHTQPPCLQRPVQRTD